MTTFLKYFEKVFASVWFSDVFDDEFTDAFDFEGNTTLIASQNFRGFDLFSSIRSRWYFRFASLTFALHLLRARLYSSQSWSLLVLRAFLELEVNAPGEVDRAMSLFLAYMMSPDGGRRENKSAIQAVTEVRSVVDKIGGNLSDLLERKKVRDDFFVEDLDKRCKPATSKHYMSSLISFFEFAISESVDIGNYTTDDLVAMKLRLYNWRKTYNRQISDERWVREEELLDSLVTKEQIQIFEQGEMARKAIIILGSAEESSSYLTMMEFTSVRDFLMTSFALHNAHRSGVSANMLMKEYEKRKLDETTCTINVRHHKTRYTHGSATVCIPLQLARLLDIYVTRIRPQISTTCENIFVTWNGKALEAGSVSRQINSVWSRSGIYTGSETKKVNMSTTLIRKSVTTAVHDEDHENAQPVADLLAHSLTTASKIYRVKKQTKTSKNSTCRDTKSSWCW